MKILHIDNEPISNRSDEKLLKDSQSFLPFYLSKKVDLIGVGKDNWKNFYKIYKNFNPDLIITEWVPASLIPLFLRKLGLIHCPITLNWGDYYAEMMGNTFKHPTFIVKLMEDYTVKNVDFITTVSRRNEKIAKEKGKTVFYIPHGVFRTDKRTKININKLKTQKENITAIYLGDQSKWKKVDHLIEAVKGLPCDLFMFGKTNPEFQKIASKNVHFMGYVDKFEVKSILEQADIVVNTGDQDCNYKIFEYINAKKAILAYDGLTNNILKNGENALLTKDFKNGLIELIKNKKLRNKISKNIQKYKVYTWEEIADMYINAYKEMLPKLNSQQFK